MDRDEYGGAPKYQKLAEMIEGRIDSGEFAPGQRIPSEGELCDEYRVSRITVRQALGALARRGLVKREQGRGTYVQPRRLRRDIRRIYSFTADMLALGLSPSSEVLEFAEAEADEEAAEALELRGERNRVTVVRRLRLANGAPLLLETTQVPAGICPRLAERPLSGGSLYQTFQETYGLAPRTATETYESIILPAPTARLLRCPKPRNQPGLAIRRVARLGDGRPLEFTVAFAKADRFTLKIDMDADVAGFRRNYEV